MLATALVKRVTDLSEKAHEAMADALDNLSSLAGNAADAGRLAKALNVLAEAEGARFVFANFVYISERMPESQPADWYMHVANGQRTDDTWSGRTNDVARAKADGARSALDQIYTLITR